ncbi:MAG: hypothetical protein MZU79_06920 [Anaerotruncus sp.]|nr:hypothetical protein [Anaerotruncus sp.]
MAMEGETHSAAYDLRETRFTAGDAAVVVPSGNLWKRTRPPSSPSWMIPSGGR